MQGDSWTCEPFILLHQLSETSTLLSWSTPPVSTRKLITDQIFVKGDGVTDFPFDWKGELSALNVEACSGK